MIFNAHLYNLLVKKLTRKSVKHNSSSVNSMFLTLKLLKNVENIVVMRLKNHHSSLLSFDFEWRMVELFFSKQAETYRLESGEVYSVNNDSL